MVNLSPGLVVRIGRDGPAGAEEGLEGLDYTAENEAEERGERGAGGLGGGGVVGDDAVNVEEKTVNLGDEEVEAAGDGGAAAQGFDVGDGVEDE